MRTIPIIVCRLVAAASLIGAIAFATRSAQKRAELEQTRSKADDLAANLTEIARLRAERETAVASAPAEAAVTSDLLAALARNGIPEHVLTQKLAEPEEPIALAAGATNITYARRSVNLTLTPMTLDQLGRFLSAWKTENPAWAVSRIEMSRAGAPSEVSYTVSMRLSATYVKDGPASPPRTAAQSGASR